MPTPIWTSIVFITVSLCAATARAGERLEFNRDIRPILAANCYQCHGPDDNSRKADMRFDQEEGVHHAFTPNSRDDSEAWQRVNSDDPDLRMPPPEAHRELKAAEIELIGTWIDQGAAWADHWSFITPRKPDLPQAADASINNPVDLFIQRRLESVGFSIGPSADRDRLLRRVTFDLTGLPPTIAEIDDFLSDTRPDAYERVVDRLLQSPHFGERMALEWMDWARYGDTSVFHGDGHRDMWPWRDWVIRAHNDNMPFNQFTVEQLAGDLLPSATVDQIIASGFNRNNATTDEGGAIAEEYRVEYAVDRVKTTSMVWMGLSIECAQCHDHKYDPISQKDYYQFYAYFNQASDPGMQTRNGNQAPVADVKDPARLVLATRLSAGRPELESNLQQSRAAADAGFPEWLATQTANPPQSALPENPILHLPLDEGTGDQVTSDQVWGEKSQTTGKIVGKPTWQTGKFAGALEIDGQNFVDLGDVANFERSDSFSYGAWIRANKKLVGAPIARMDDGNAYRGFDTSLAGKRLTAHIIHEWPNNALKVVTKNEVIQADKWQHIFVTYDGSSKASGIKIYIDGKSQILNIEQDSLSDTIRTDTPLYLGRRNPGTRFQGLIDSVRVYDRMLTDDQVSALAGEDIIAQLLAIAADERSDQQREQLHQHYLNRVNEPYRDAVKQLADLKKRIRDLEKPISTVMIMKDVDQPRMTFVLDRGNYDSPNKKQPVEPNTLAILPPLPANAPPNRLGLARWLVDPQHPLTARVTVNRYWQMMFGTGLVKTVEDFGSQGEWPSHPDLLDWLAVDFVENGWDIKHTIKQMVMSATYRQSSRVSRQLLSIDPENRLLSRGPRFRLQGEFIRDNALASSGLLVRKIGGPAVKPYQPDGLWNEVSINTGLRFKRDNGEKLYRRSMYTYWKRSAPAPSLAIFDTPTRDKCTMRRSRTNTPLQALVTLNDVQFVEAARALAQRAIREGGENLQQQITYAYRLAAGVKPASRTLAELVAAYHKELVVFTAEEERANKLIALGESKRDENIESPQLAAMSIVTSIILNLDETLTRG